MRNAYHEFEDIIVEEGSFTQISINNNFTESKEVESDIVTFVSNDIDEPLSLLFFDDSGRLFDGYSPEDVFDLFSDETMSTGEVIVDKILPLITAGGVMILKADDEPILIDVFAKVKNKRRTTYAQRITEHSVILLMNEGMSPDILTNQFNYLFAPYSY